LLVGAFVLAAGAARAQDVPDEHDKPKPRHAVEGELSYFAKNEANASIDLLLVQLGGRYVLDHSFSLTGTLGIATLVSTPRAGDGDVVWRPSNPEVMGYYAVPLSSEGERSSLPMRLTLGVGVAGPVATITRGPDARLYRATLSYAQAMDGLHRMWRWAANRTTAITSAVLDVDAHSELLLSFEVKPALLIPSREEFLHEKLDLVVPTAFAASTGNELIRGGARLRAVLLPTFDVDQAQLSIEPFALLHVGGVLAEARYTLNLDEPVAGKRGPQAWGLHLRIGAEL
jgi:hypothetical protein